MWRPKKWRNPYSKGNVRHLDRTTLRCEMKDGTCMDNLIREARKHTFEEGAEAMLEALFKLAEESPTGKFEIDTHTVNVFSASSWVKDD